MATASQLQAHIDEYVSRQVIFLHHLRSRRNALSPISRLPGEVLTEIFIHCTRDHYERGGGDKWSWRSPINISRVCQYWRNLALACPTLWSYLLILSPSHYWTTESLARSKDVLLKLKVVMSEDWDEVESRYFHRLLNFHVERTEELCLDFQDACFDIEILRHLPSDVPHLRNLKILADGFCLPKDPFKLFKKGTPALRSLELSGCADLWYSFDLSTLVTLSLCNASTSICSLIDPASFLATLGSMPYLKHLHLRHALPLCSSQKVTLRHLSCLSIADSHSTIASFFNCANIPLKTKLQLHCRPHGHLTASKYSPLVTFLAQRFTAGTNRTLPSPMFRSLVIVFHDDVATLTFSLLEHDYDGLHHTSHAHWGGSNPLKIALVCHPTIWDYCALVSMQAIQTLHVIPPQAHQQSESDFWRRLLSALPDLRRCKLSTGTMPAELASSLRRPSNGAAGQDANGPCQDGMLAPALEELALYRVDFPAQTGSSVPSPTLGVHALYDALASRHKSRGRLTMVRCREENQQVNGKPRYTNMNMVGEWHDGHVHILEEPTSEVESLDDDAT